MTYGTTVPHPAPQGHTGRTGAAGPGSRPPGDLPRLLPVHGAVPVDLHTHLSRHAAPPYFGHSGKLIPVLKAAGLTGRGGAAFPVHRKLRAVAEARTQPVVIGNGAEGEPASDKDKSLLWISPHLVLDGLQLAAEAVGSQAVALYVHRNARLQERLRAAIAERAAARTDVVPVEIIDAPPRFLAGEESALANRISGQPAMPRFKPPRVFERGVVGRPTLVHNVETLAHIALIARYGPAWFRAAGTPQEPGSMLCTLHQTDGRRDVVETELGTPLRDLLRLDGTQAVLSGGYHGAWVPAADAARMTLSNEHLQAAGAFVGAGVLVGLPGRPLRDRGDRTGHPLPGPGVGRAVRAVLQRPAPHRRRPGRGGQSPARSPCDHGHDPLGGAGGGPGCLPPSGRDHPVRPQCPARLPG